MTKLSFDQFVNLRLLLSIERIGPGRIRKLLSKFRTFESILTADVHSLIQVEGINKTLAKSIVSKSNLLKDDIRRNIEKEFEQLNRLNGNIITVWDTDYPELLKKIYDPPLILYCIGTFTELDKYCISIVGTRQPSTYGKAQAEYFASELSQNNLTIVSGLARGIDSISHKAVLKDGKRTIAVIGSGLDVIYPPENKKLFEEIAQTGMVISEFEVGTKPDAQNFPRRNRIISGLSLATIVVETGISGGAMQTASYSLDQGREVYAIPGNLNVKQSEGTNLLIQKGEAKLIIHPEDILQDLELKLKPIVKRNIPKPPVDLNMFEEKIIQYLDSSPKHIDLISNQSCLSVSDCLVYLLSLEFKGLVRQLPGKMFALI